MAIYRTGTASLNAQGVIVGVGTNWQDKLSLVRVGATMIFQTAPLTICTISSIVSPTEMRATATDGAVVAAGTKYVILLHDSITVDGLAQDVAETLRYYQSKETVIEDAIEFFQNFDWERIVAVGNQVKADAQTASTAATNAKTSETNSKASENAAKASQTAAAASQTAAKTSETNAKASETAAGTSRTAAASSATAAAGSATAAAGSATAAKTSETNAKTSETNANSSKVAAAASQTAAAGSASAASGSATAAKTSETNAKTSETNAASSKTAAAASATTATQQADRAKTEADRAATANPDNQLKKANNLSDVADVATSRQNLQLERFYQYAAETGMKIGQKNLYIKDGGGWGVLDLASNKAIALPIGSGGTGSLDAAGARGNLDVYSKSETLNNVGVGASPRDIPAMDSAQKGFGRVTGSTTDGPGSMAGAGWVAQYDGSPSYAGMFVQPDGNRVFAGGVMPSQNGGKWQWHEVPTLDRANIWTQPQTFNSPAVNFKSNAANPMTINSSNPAIAFEETDAPAGSAQRYILVMDGGNIRIQEENTGAGSRVFDYNSASKRIAFPHVSSNTVTASGDIETAGGLAKVTSRSYPAIELISSAVPATNVGQRVVLENDGGNGTGLYHSRGDGNTSRSSYYFPKTDDSLQLIVPGGGGLAHNGTSRRNPTAENMDVVGQGWTNVGGTWANTPAGASAIVYGSLFTQATQGLRRGDAPGANNPANNWWQQRFYNTSNEIYTRINTNAGAWGAWAKITTSVVSDERLKDIRGNMRIEGALDNINRMEFKLFSFKEEKSPEKETVVRRGVISQQIREIDKEYTMNVGGYWHLDQTPMLLDGLAAIKALRARDVENKERISKLESDVEELKALVSALTAK